MRNTALALGALVVLALVCAGLFLLIQPPAGSGPEPAPVPVVETPTPPPAPVPAPVPADPTPSAAARTAGLSVEGVVVDLANQPLPGVAVRLVRVGGDDGGAGAAAAAAAAAFTDPTGAFRIPDLGAGTYGITLELAGYHGEPENPRKVEAGDGGLRLVMVMGASVRGRVTDADGNGIPARVSAGRGFETLATDEGAYELSSVPAGATELTATHSQWAAETLRLELVAGESLQDIDFVLERGLSIAGRVVDAGGVPVVGAVVSASPAPKSSSGRGAMSLEIEELLAGRHRPGDSGEPTGPHARTNESGEFRIHGLDPGVFRLKPTHDDYIDETLRAEAYPAGKEDVLLHMTRAATVAGIVLGPGGAPVEGAGISVVPRKTPTGGQMGMIVGVFGSSMGGARYDARSDEKGEFLVTHVRPGKSSIWAAADRMQDSERMELDLTPGEQRQGTILELRAGVTITGRVLDEAGAPIAGAQVRSISLGRPTALGEPGGGAVIEIAGFAGDFGGMTDGPHVTTDASGGFEIGGLEEGSRYRLTARRDGFTQAADVSVVAPTVEALVTMAVAARIVGQVVTERGVPASGARVSLGKEWRTWSEHTYDDGSFEFIDVEPGAYQLRADHKEEGLSEARDLTVAAGEAVVGLVLVLGVGGQITGRVVDGSGNPVADARVNAHSPERMMAGDHRPRRTTTDADGNFVLVGVQDAVYEVSATAEGFVGSGGDRGFFSVDGVGGSGPQRKDRKSARPGDFVRLELSRGLVVVGQAISASGEPQASYTISVLGEQERGMESGLASQRVADAEGRFEILGLDPERATEVRIRAPGHAELVVPLPALAGEEFVDLGVLRLHEGARVSGVVVSGAGPVAGARVSIGPRAKEGEEEEPQSMIGVTRSVVVSSGFGEVYSIDTLGGRNVRTGEDGAFTFTNVADGEFTITCSHQSFAQATADVVVSGERSVEGVRIHMRAGGTIEGTVLDAVGQPAEGAAVRASITDPPDQDVQRRTRADARGHYEIAGLVAGTYRVSASQGNGPSRSERSASAEVTDGARVVVDFVDPVMCVLSGKVMGFEPPAGSAGRFIGVGGTGLSMVRKEGGGASGHTEIGDGGAYRFGPLPPGDYVLRLPGGGSQEVTLPAAAEHRFDFELPRGSISGRVVRADGGIVGAALLVVQTEREGSGAHSGIDGDGQFEVTSLHRRIGGDGRFEVTSLSPGTYTLVAMIPGHGEGRIEGIEVAGAAVTGVEVRVEAKEEGR